MSVEALDLKWRETTTLTAAVRVDKWEAPAGSGDRGVHRNFEILAARREDDSPGNRKEKLFRRHTEPKNEAIYIIQHMAIPLSK